eukprot:g34181.t1
MEWSNYLECFMAMRPGHPSQQVEPQDIVTLGVCVLRVLMQLHTKVAIRKTAVLARLLPSFIQSFVHDIPVDMVHRRPPDKLENGLGDSNGAGSENGLGLHHDIPSRDYFNVIFRNMKQCEHLLRVFEEKGDSHLQDNQCASKGMWKLNMKLLILENIHELKRDFT